LPVPNNKARPQVLPPRSTAQAYKLGDGRQNARCVHIHTPIIIGLSAVEQGASPTTPKRAHAVVASLNNACLAGGNKTHAGSRQCVVFS